MKSFLISLVLLVAACHLISLFLPWWSFAIVVGLVLFWLDFPSKRAFLLGFLAIFLNWLIWSLWMHQSNATILTPKIGQLFGGLPTLVILLVSALIGGLIGGFSGWAGAAIRQGIRANSSS